MNADAIGHVGFASEHWTSGVLGNGRRRPRLVRHPFGGGNGVEDDPSQNKHPMEISMKTSILAAAVITCCTLSAPLVLAQGMSAPADPMMGGPQGDPRMMGGPQGWTER